MEGMEGMEGVEWVEWKQAQTEHCVMEWHAGWSQPSCVVPWSRRDLVQ